MLMLELDEELRVELDLVIDMFLSSGVLLPTERRGVF